VLPPLLKQILYFTPFPYQLYFPISIYLGRVAGAELWHGLAIQLAWVLAAYGFARWMWRRGIKHYSAFGGNFSLSSSERESALSRPAVKARDN